MGARMKRRPGIVVAGIVALAVAGGLILKTRYNAALNDCYQKEYAEQSQKQERIRREVSQELATLKVSLLGYPSPEKPPRNPMQRNFGLSGPPKGKLDSDDADSAIGRYAKELAAKQKSDLEEELDMAHHRNPDKDAEARDLDAWFKDKWWVSSGKHGHLQQIKNNLNAFARLARLQAVNQDLKSRHKDPISDFFVQHDPVCLQEVSW